MEGQWITTFNEGCLSNHRICTPNFLSKMTTTHQQAAFLQVKEKGEEMSGELAAGTVGILGVVLKAVTKQSTQRYVATCLYIKNILSPDRGLGAFAQVETSAWNPFSPTSYILLLWSTH